MRFQYGTCSLYQWFSIKFGLIQLIHHIGRKEHMLIGRGLPVDYGPECQVDTQTGPGINSKVLPDELPEGI